MFIDSNIWLSLYHFSSDDLDQFRKLKDRIDKDIRLYIPVQVRSEIQRNRDAKIQDALKEFRSFNFKFPTFCKNYDQYASFSTEYNTLKRKHSTWVKQIEQDIADQQLEADIVLADFFSDEILLECSDEMVRRAETRYLVGNPPGKDNKYGDAINWECLLENVPDGEDIYFVSGDKDYASVLDSDRFNLFLTKEWETRKKGKVYFFKSLVQFLKAHFADIELKAEQEKEELINDLANSRNFLHTHKVVAKLSQYDDWTSQQIDSLCTAATENTQVQWILGDDDISEFFNKIIRSPKAASAAAEELKKQLSAAETEDEDAVPEWLL